MIEGAEEECVARGSLSIGTARCVTITQVAPGSKSPTGPFFSFLLSHCQTGQARRPIKSCMLIWPGTAAEPLIASGQRGLYLYAHVPLLMSVTHCEKAEAGHELVTRQHPRHMLLSHYLTLQVYAM